MLSRLARWFRAADADSSEHPRLWPAVDWRIAETEDWPPVEPMGRDFDWARRMGTGFVADFDKKRWFLFHRDWFGWPDPPEWSLASYDIVGGAWLFYNDFDVLPKNWSVPENQNAYN